ncbi:MAG: aminopeptidase P family protein [Dermatophilaceae bacterium]
MSEQQPKAEHRGIPITDEFRAFVSSGWAPSDDASPPLAEVAPFAAARREALSAAFPGERLVIPAGGLKVRSNDTDYAFRPHSAFAHLTGLGADREPDAVLVLEPRACPVDGPPGVGVSAGHDARLYLRPPSGRNTDEFFTDSRHGEFWVGPRPSLAAVSAELGIVTVDLCRFENEVSKDVGAVQVRVIPDADAAVTGIVDAVRATVEQVAVAAVAATQVEAREAQHQDSPDVQLARFCSTLRLRKDAWEIQQMRDACAATAGAFEDVVAALPEAIARGRGERWIEGTFQRAARHAGNGVGYDSICAASDHANTLHWVRNTGDIGDGDLVLIDAGIEVDSLFTADITRTLPANGTFTPVQKKVYEAVRAAQAAGIEAARPGALFKDVHAAAIRVIAQHLFEWGFLPEGVTVDASLDKDGGQWHRRWMVHGTSHHLGIDVHDCALALREDYLDARLDPGMILTVEPGLYFKADDLLVPSEYRGIGVRIEDDILVTDDGCEILSTHLPREADGVEAWMRSIWSGVRRPGDG